MKPKKISAIIYTSIPQHNGKHFLKYSYVGSDERSKGKFLNFAAKFPGAEYVNFYDNQTREFIERIYLK